MAHKDIAGQKLLVVDDEPAVRRYLAEILTRNGAVPVEAVDGQDALDQLAKDWASYNAIVSDVRMPNIDGLQLAEANYEQHFIPFIVCTVISDAAMALRFLKFGVHDYIVKPVDEAALVTTVRTALDRRSGGRLYAEDETPYAGNLGQITISARLAEVHRVRNWIGLKASGLLSPLEEKKFIAFVSEFLMNAYEHGSLLISEEEKGRLIDDGTYQDTLAEREKKCKAKIDVAVSTLPGEIAVNITDPGFGFNYEHYLHMKEEEMMDRLLRPNGRGIHMALQYFDKISFGKGGSSVILIKKLGGKQR